MGFTSQEGCISIPAVPSASESRSTHPLAGWYTTWSTVRRVFTSTGCRISFSISRRLSAILLPSFSSTHGAPAKEVHNSQQDDRTEQGDEERWQAKVVLVDRANA